MGEKVKTRDRILVTALALFNDEGESRVSTVDMAAALGISPGNLYYHFRGKEEIIVALFDSFEIELRQVLSATIQQKLSLEDHWTFLYIVFEEIDGFRFFYDSPAAVLDRCPSLGPRFSRLIGLKRSTLAALLAALEEESVLAFGAGERLDIADRMAAHFVTWLSYSRLLQPNADQRSVIHDGVRHAMMMTAPYATTDRRQWRTAVDAYFGEQVRRAKAKRNA